MAINTVISLAVALPAAYAFSRYRFLGDKHRVLLAADQPHDAAGGVPAAVLPALHDARADGHAHRGGAGALLFNVPLAVWILEGFMSGVPREIDETAYIDGYSFPRFFVTIFMPLIKAGVGVAAFFCFMFSWVELLLARTLTSVNAKPIVAIMTRTVSASGMDWGVLAAAGVLTIVPGAIVIWFVRNYIAQGLRAGPGLRRRWSMFAWMAWTLPTAVFFVLHRADARRHDGVGAQVADRRCARASCRSRRRAATGCSSACSRAAYVNLAFVGGQRQDDRLVRSGAGAVDLDQLRRCRWLLLALVMRKG